MLRWTSRGLFALLSIAVASACEEASPNPADDDDGGAVVDDPATSREPAQDAGSTSADADAPVEQDASAADAGSAERDAGAPVEQDADAPIEQDAGPAPEVDAGSADTDAGSDAASADDASAADDAAPPAEELFTTVYDVIAQSCIGCHGAGKKLDLSTREIAYQQLVGVSAQYPTCAADASVIPVRVVPGDAENSLLMMKLENRQTCGSAMPKTGLLPQTDVDKFRAWIVAGAPEH